jgi:hypothetical protein
VALCHIYCGFVFDVSGTLFMHKMAEGRFDLIDSHTLTGQIALWLIPYFGGMFLAMNH